MTDTKPILTPCTIGTHTLQNRLVLAPMSRASALDDGTPTQNMADYYAEFAEGGYGLLITEGAFVDDLYSQCYSNQPGLTTHTHEKGWETVLDAVRRDDGKIILQLIHAGAVSQHVPKAFAPSPVRPKGEMLQGYGYKQGAYEVPGELTLKDIEDIETAFVETARAADRLGFDGVEIHCANGYLLDQFLTPETNLRADHYGGSLTNRLRITTNIIERAQTATSKPFLVGVRLSQAKATDQDYFWENGLDDAREIFTGVAKAGADYIHLASEKNGYAYHSLTRDGDNLTAFAKTITGLPVIANGGLQDMNLANEIISNEQADFISIGKAALLNPDLPKRLQANLPIRDFTFEMFQYGVTIEAQQRWEMEKAA
ncbi:tRNA-dihydrouridine synthase [Roseibium sp.]|uniref:oxidoreductase n=1 Tax=Roseibium sp. TaxID=1936156 RepID=UPI003B51ECBF